MLTWLFAAVAAASSIYNPFDPIPTRPDPGLRANANLGLSLAGGNLDQTDVRASGGLLHFGDRAEARLVGAMGWARTNGTQTSGSSFGHARYAHHLGREVWPFAFTQLDSNVFRRVLLRNLAGAGVEWRVYPSDALQLTAATSLMTEYQDLSEDAHDEDEGLVPRSSSYVSFAAALGDRVRAGGTGFFQPRIDGLDKLANYRAMGQGMLVVDLNGAERIDPETGETAPRRLTSAVRLVLRADYDSNPPTDVEPLDVSFTTSFGLSWK